MDHQEGVDPEQLARNRRIQEFLNQEFTWKFAAGEANFLMQVMAFLVQENPAFVPGPTGQRERLNFQSIRQVVLFLEKLNVQLQQHAAAASVILDEMRPASDRVQ